MARQSDVGNSIRFAKEHGDHAKHVAGFGWLVWDGRRWIVDDEGGAHRLARQTVRRIFVEAAAYTSEGDRKEWARHALDSERHARIVAMVEQAKSQPGITADLGEFDQHPMLLNVLNGVIDLRTGELLPHAPELKLTRLAPVEFDPNAPCPLWEGFLDKALRGDVDLIAFLRRAVGYSLTGSTREDATFILFGPTGSNGKTTFLETAAQLLGDYAAATDPNTFMRRKSGSSNTPELAKLRGVRLVGSYESSQGAMFDEARLKALTGGDVIQAAAKYKAPIEYRPEFKVWFRTNHLPQVDPHDEGVWRRVHVVPFLHRFAGATLDKSFREELPGREGPGILAWAIRGVANGRSGASTRRSASSPRRNRTEPSRKTPSPSGWSAAPPRARARGRPSVSTRLIGSGARTPRRV